MGAVQITIEVNPDALRSYSDSHLAAVCHVVQANPADGFADRRPGELAERVGREIVRRWLGSVSPELWHHQGGHYFWNELRQLGKWVDGVFVPATPGGPATPSADGESGGVQ